MCLSELKAQLVSVRMQGHSLAFLSGFRIQHCLKRWCGSQIQLSCGTSAAAAPIRLSAQEIPYATSAVLKKQKKKSIVLGFIGNLEIM